MYPRIFSKSCEQLRRHGPVVAFLAFTALTGALLSGVADPLITKTIVDALVHHNLRIFVEVALLAICVYTLMRIGTAASERLTQKLQSRVCLDVVLDMVDTFYQYPYARIVQQNQGYFVSRIYDEPAQVVANIVLVIQFLGATVTVIGAVAVCVWLSWKVALIISLFVPLLRWCGLRYSAKIRTAAAEGNEQEARIREQLGHMVGSYKAARLFNLQKLATTRFALELKSYFQLLQSQVNLASAFRAFSGTLLSYAELLVLLSAGIAVLKGRLTIGGLFAFVSAYAKLISGSQSIISFLPSIASMRAQLRRLQDFKSGVISEDAVGIQSENMKIVGAAYSWGGRRVFDSFDFWTTKGEKVLITGANGTGKSTLAHILAGLLEIENGTKQLPHPSAVSAMLPPFEFIPGTIKDNIDYESLSDQKRSRVLNFATKCGLADRLGEDARQLSEGEKKKIQTLMAVLKDADFYIFDEPLANVDTASAPAIMETIFEATRGKSLIVIMHGGEQYRKKFDRQVELGHAFEPALSHS